MKTGILATMLLTVASTPSAGQRKAVRPPAPRPAATRPLPVFEFMGQNTETATSMTSLNGKACSQEKPDIRECTDMDDPTIAGQRLRWLSLNFYKDRLYRVYGNTNKYSFGELLTAFTAKYGAPVLSTEKWQAKSGATFDNSVATWRFRGGKLVLESLGLDLNTGQFEFASTSNSPPAAPPKVDF